MVLAFQNEQELKASIPCGQLSAAVGNKSQPLEKTNQYDGIFMRKIISVLVIMTFFSIFMPKRLTRIEIYATSFFSLFYGKTVDEILDLKKNFYGYFGKGLQYIGLVMQFLIYPTVNLLFLNYFPHKLRNRILYILGWSVFSILFEQLTRKKKFFYYTKWKWWYSALLYPFIFTTLFLNLWFVRKLIKSLKAGLRVSGNETVLE